MVQKIEIESFKNDYNDNDNDSDDKKKPKKFFLCLIFLFLLPFDPLFQRLLKNEWMNERRNSYDEKWHQQ